MKSFWAKIFLECFIISFLLTAPSTAQWCQQFWIKVSDNKGSTPYTLLFGNHIDATKGYGAQKDSLNPTIIERESPPLPPNLGVVWRPPWPTVNWGFGFLTYDFRGYSNSDGRDTFLLYFINQSAPDADITLTWPDAIYLGSRCNSMIMSETTSKLSTINMFNQSSITIPAAGDSGIFKIYIYKGGVFMLDDYDECWWAVNENFLHSQSQYYLSQNYPNPFNPTTNFGFAISDFGFVTLKVFNILGQEVATLVNEEKHAGRYNVAWDASQFPSGVYYYKLSSFSIANQDKSFTQLKKMLLVK
mgnify:CR=1 FL=1